MTKDDLKKLRELIEEYHKTAIELHKQLSRLY